MQEFKEDLRVIRTRKLLSNTLFNMLESQSIEKINVKDICEKAMVQRTTFYTHFEDKYHLLSYIFDEIKDEMFQSIIEDIENIDQKDLFKRLSIVLFDFLDKKKDNIKRIAEHNQNEKVQNCLYKSIERGIDYTLNKLKNQIPYNIPLSAISSFFSGGISNLLFWWIQNQEQCSKERLLTFIDEFFEKNILLEKK